jgi:hypothetical protein
MNRSEWSEQVRIGPFRIRVSRSEWSDVSLKTLGSDQPSDQSRKSGEKSAIAFTLAFPVGESHV